MDDLDRAKIQEQMSRQIALDKVKNSDIETEAPDEEDGVRYCKDCGEEMDLDRLKVRPHSVRCVDCKTDREQKIKGYR